MADADSGSPVRPAAPRRDKRTGGQKAAIVVAMVVSISCFAVAGALAYGQHLVEQRRVIDIENPAEAAAAVTIETIADETGPESTTGTVEVTVDGSVDDTRTPSPTTFPPADPEAKNFLVTGADNGACIDPDSPFAPAFGDRSALGERSDTIMVWRVDPANERAAVLSLPRDLWVTISGGGAQSRINSAYRRNEPQLLIDTIYENFGIGIDHFIQVDFCAFKTLVDAVGGVSVPFTLPTRDTGTGLNVPEAGCFNFTGDHALAYVRSRYYEVLPADSADPSSDSAWEMDQSFDLGRISRQQDFLRRLLAKVLDEGMLNPSVVRGLYNTMTDYVVTDNELSVHKMLEFAGVLRAIDPDVIPSYQVVTTPQTIAGNSVLVPELDAEGMADVLALFRGERSLSKLPDQTGGDGRRASGSVASPSRRSTPPGTAGTQAGVPVVVPTSPPTATAPASTAPAATVPVDNAPADIQFGIVPDPAIRC